MDFSFPYGLSPGDLNSPELSACSVTRESPVEYHICTRDTIDELAMGKYCQIGKPPARRHRQQRSASAACLLRIISLVS